MLNFYSCDGAKLFRNDQVGSLSVTDSLYDSYTILCHRADLCVRDIDDNNYLSAIDPNMDPISLLEVAVVRHSMKKGVGSVGLNNDHLRKLNSNGVDFGFQFIANISWDLAYPYLDWRTSFVYPLHKGKHLDRALASSYRPISHSHTVGKWMESLVFARLKAVAESHIVPYQAGGMAQNGAIHQLIRVCETLQTLLSQTESDGAGDFQYANYVAVALADCSKAFDRMDRRLIIHKLHKEGVSGKLLEWIAGYFHERWIRVVVDAVVSPPASTHQGGPQGSVLTLFCWLIYVNDICSPFPTQPCSDPDQVSLPDASLLMDDCAAWASGDDPLTVIDTLNARLRDIYQWSLFNGMVFDFAKFNILSIGHNAIPTDLQKRLVFGPGSPPWVSSARFLGATLDPLLTFKQQIRDITKKVKAGMYYLNPFSHFARGSQPSVLKGNVFFFHAIVHFLGQKCKS